MGKVSFQMARSCATIVAKRVTRFVKRCLRESQLTEASCAEVIKIYR